MPQHSYGIQRAELVVECTDIGAKLDIISCHNMAAIGLSWLGQDVCQTCTGGSSCDIRLGQCGSVEQMSPQQSQNEGVEGFPAILLL